MKSQDNTELSSIGMFRLVGYGLILFAIIDWINILVPVRWMDSAWTFNSIGAVIERVAVPLLALALVFSGETALRQRWEKLAVKFLSWGSLAASAAFLLMIPLLLMLTMRLNVQTNTQVNAQVNAQMSQLNQVEERVGKATPQDLTTLLQSLNRQGNTPANVSSPTALKEQLIGEVNQLRTNVKNQAETVRSNQTTALFKNSAKWTLGALISSVLFFGLWRFSGWARRKRRVTARTTASVGG